MRENGDRRNGGTGRAYAAAVIAVVLVAAIILTGCDLVIFDEDALRGAREAAGMRERTVIEVGEWEEYGADHILQPAGFLPDTPGGSSGYLIAEDDGEVIVLRLKRDRVIGREGFRPDTAGGAFYWSARVIPSATDADPPLAPPVVVVVRQDGRVNTRLLYANPDAPGELVASEMNFAAILTAEGIGERQIIAVQLLSAEIQLLALDESSGQVQELFITVSGDALVRWDHLSGQTSAAALEYGFLAGSATFPRPQRSDGNPAVAISYGNARLSDTDPNDRRGYLTFADGDYRGAPLRTFSWLTDLGGTTPEELTTWHEPIRSVSEEGLIRNAATGSMLLIDARSAAGSAPRREDYGTLWYAGRYPASDGTAINDIYSAVGFSRALSGWSLTITVYED